VEQPAKPPSTEKGRATRERIVAAAAELMRERGVAVTSLDDVRAATGTSKSQLYHYFGDREGLVRAVVRRTSDLVLARQASSLDAVESWEDLDRWCEGMAGALEMQSMRGGCPIGTLAAALADTDETARGMLSEAFQTWGEHIRAALDRLRERGLLRPEVDINVLTVTTLAAVQGGLLLSKTLRSSEPLRASLRGAVSYLQQQAPRPTETGKTER
jgi:AcrR family transcriptional regulator